MEVAARASPSLARAPPKPPAPTRSAGAHVPIANMIIALALLASNAWRVADQQDPALLPGSSYVCSSPHAAAAFAGWPAGQGPLAKLAYATRHFGAVYLHIARCQWPWSFTTLWHLACAAVAVLAAWRLRCGPRGAATASALAWVLSHLPYPLPLALCSAGGPPTSTWPCLPSSSAAIVARAVEPVLSGGWQLGLFASVLLLPPGWQLLASFTQWLAACSILALLYARHPDIAAGAADGAPLLPAMPLEWGALASTVLERRFLVLLCRSLAGGVMLPVLFSLVRVRLFWCAAAGDNAGAGASAKRPKARSRDPDAVSPSGENAAAGGACDAAAAVGASAPPSLLAAGGPARRLSLMQASERLKARRASGPALAKPLKYSSCVRRSALVVKVAVDDAAPLAGDTAGLHAAVRGAIATALQTAAPGGGARAEAAPLPQLQSFVAFPGCLMAAVQVVGAQRLAPADIAASLAQLLPRGLTVLDVTAVSYEEQVLGADHMWCEPVALAAGDAPAKAAVMLPPALMARLAALGCGLRIVAAAGTHGKPIVDLTVRPEDSGWPADGRVRLALPCDAGPLLLVTLLAAPAAPAGRSGTAHGVDVFITSLPLLVLPPAARNEAALLWQDLCQEEAWSVHEAADGHSAAAAATAFSSQWMPFAMDLGLALDRHGPCGSEEERRQMGADLHELLAERSMSACAQAMVASGVAMPPHLRVADAGTSRPPVGCTPSPKPGAVSSISAAPRTTTPARLPSAWTTAATAARGVVLGFGGQERAYQQWRVQQLLGWDVVALKFDLFRLSAIHLYLLWFAVAVNRQHGLLASGYMAAASAAQVLPVAALMASHARHSRWRGWVVAASTAAAGLASCLPLALDRLDVVSSLAVLMRPLAHTVTMTLVLPAIQRLSMWQQALACTGSVLSAVMFSAAANPGAWSLRWWGPWVFLSVGYAAVQECRLRCQWLLGERGSAKAGKQA